MEWSLIDIDDQVFSVPQQSDKDHSHLLVYNPTKPLLDYVNLFQYKAVNLGHLTTQVAEMKLLVSLNNKTGECEVIKLRQFENNNMIKHLIDDYTSIFNKLKFHKSCLGSDYDLC